MATLNEKPNSKAGKGRSRKTTPLVDLTAMVDLMFLLTTFFMLTTSLSTSNAADIAKPDEGSTMDYPASRTMTILLGKDNQVVYYLGLAEKANMKTASVAELQTKINECKQRVAKIHQGSISKHMIVIIKPTATAKFKNFVDVVDEMKIGNIKSYTVDDAHFLNEEEAFIREKGL